MAFNTERIYFLNYPKEIYLYFTMGQNSFWISIAPSFVQTAQQLERGSISMSATVRKRLVLVQTQLQPK